MTNCPLMGNDPALWRRQIRNWPYILKIKGTALSLDIFLHSIDVDEHKLYTFFRDANGNLVEEKPQGLPFKDSSGLWHNIRTHFFDLDIIYNNEHYLTWQDWYPDLMRSMDIWLTRAKPFHSELRNLNVILCRDTEQHIAFGEVITQASHRAIDIEQKTSGDSDFEITAGIAALQSYRHIVNIQQAAQSETESTISIGTSITQAGQHCISIEQETSANTELHITTGLAVSQNYLHDVGIEQSTQSISDLALDVEALVTQGKQLLIGIQQQTSSYKTFGITAGCAVCTYVRIEIGTAA